MPITPNQPQDDLLLALNELAPAVLSTRGKVNWAIQKGLITQSELVMLMRFLDCIMPGYEA